MVEQEAAEPTSSYEAVNDSEDGETMEAVSSSGIDEEEGGGGAGEDQQEGVVDSADEEVLVPVNSGRFGGRHSLASAATTPCLAKYLIPLLAIVAHGLFIYGQTAPMWRLSLAAEDIKVYANATSVASKEAFDILGWDKHLHYELEKNHTIQTFTYGFAVQELWEAKGMPGVFLPRVAAVLLVLFSGIWPHVKLVWLNATWFRSKISLKARSSTLNWLATLGKWSLADVLTVCVMVGVLNLEWIIDPPLIKEKVMNHLPIIMDLIKTSYNKEQICDYFLHKDCKNASWGDRIKCAACETFVGKSLNDPDWLKRHGQGIVDGVKTNGGGHVQLSVVGMPGIYFFCGAVILSVLLSVIVDMYHLRDVEMKRHSLHHREEPTGPTEENTVSSIPTRSMQSASGDEISEVSEPLLSRQSTQVQPEPMEFDEGSLFSHPVVVRSTSFLSKIRHLAHIPSIVTLGVVVVAAYMPSMKRHVQGAIPMLLRDILNVQFNKEYSLQTLSDTTGAAGGMDIMLMATFSIFCVAGPLLRGVLIVMLHFLQFKGNPNHVRIRIVLSKAVLFLGAFCAWEVFMCAMFMVELLMPSITDTIVNTPLCKEVSQGDLHGSCLQVAFTRSRIFYSVLVGFALLVTMTNYQQYVMKQERIPPGTVPYVFLDTPSSDGQDDIEDDDHPLRLQEQRQGQETVQDPRQRLVGLAAAMEEDSQHDGGRERTPAAETDIV